MGTKSRGLHRYAVEQYGPESSEAAERYVLSDVVTTLMKTHRGETVVITHDTSSPRPYSRNILIQGTRGLVRKYPEPRVHVEGDSEAHTWDPMDPWMEKFDHPVWKKLEKASEGAGHGGMDFIEDYRLIEGLRAGRPPDMDVYDAAMMSAVIELSGRSISRGSEPMPFPDFTRGGWKATRKLEIMKEQDVR
jgi:hypothetical protein